MAFLGSPKLFSLLTFAVRATQPEPRFASDAATGVIFSCLKKEHYAPRHITGQLGQPPKSPKATYVCLTVTSTMSSNGVETPKSS